MLDLDKYINNTISVKLKRQEIHVKEPTIAMIGKIDAIEDGVNKENAREKRVEIAAMMLSYNEEGRKIKEEELMEMPYEAVIAVINTVAKMRLEADKDPN